MAELAEADAAHQLEEAGDFIVHDFLHESVILVKQEDGSVRAFFNVCMHRGNRLVLGDVASVPRIVCGYHGWQFDIDGVLAQVRDYADGLQMTGGTALYDSVLVALEHTLAQRAKNPEYQYSVVAFTDGENTEGRNLERFKAAYAQLPEDVRAIPVFMVLFGEAKEADLKDMVKTTGGRVFDARKTPLYAVFKDIRAYQ